MVSGAVGRTAETRAVTNFLDQASTAPSALFLEGEAGIGKTTVWLIALERARARDYRVLAARTSPTESVLGYGTLADLLSEVDDAAFADLPESQRRALDRVRLQSDDDGEGSDSRAVAAGFLSVIERQAAASPLLIAVDDVQWLDPSSRQVLAFAARRLAGRVGLLVTERTRPGGARASSWLQLFRPESTRILTVGPMSLGGLHAVLSERLGKSFSRPAMAYIAEVSGGNPLFALELGRALATAAPGSTLPIPGSLAELVQARVGGLPEDVLWTLLAVACVGAPTIATVARATDAQPEDVVRLLERAEGDRIIAIDGHRVRFSHPLLSRGVYAAVSAAERRAMHRRLADIVDNLELKARHLALATTVGDARTLQHLDDAARSARARGAPAAAAELLEMAMHLGGDTPERRIRSARSHLDAGDSARAGGLLESAVDSLAPGELRSKGFAQLAAVRLFDDHFLEAATLLQRALGESGDNQHQRAQILVTLAWALFNSGHIDAAVATVEDAVAHAERLGHPPLLCQALAMHVHLNFLLGAGVDQQSLHFAMELEGDAEIPAPFRPSLHHAVLQAWTGHLAEGRDELQAIRQRCVERGEEIELVPVTFNSFLVELWRGDIAGAKALADDAMERSLQLGGDLAHGIALTMGAALAALRGDEPRARADAQAALAASERCGSSTLAIWPVAILGFLELSLRDHHAALAILEPALAMLEATPLGPEIITAPFVPDAAEAMVELGRLDSAEKAIGRLEENGQRLQRPWLVASGARCRSLLSAARGDTVSAIVAAERALVAHERLPMPFERGRTLLLLGKLLRRQRRRDPAAAAIRESLDIFDRTGASMWAAHAREELARTEVVAGGEAALTASERRVAELAASGKTNRDVAAALFISPKTVEANLARVYRKLGIRSRAELGRHLGRAQT
ncbi:MAG: AAA family ATPase [Mycobacterium sp.]|nr:AAA family ATPase [Mycobacterium sp.]